MLSLPIPSFCNLELSFSCGKSIYKIPSYGLYFLSHWIFSFVYTCNLTLLCHPCTPAQMTTLHSENQQYVRNITTRCIYIPVMKCYDFNNNKKCQKRHPRPSSLSRLLIDSTYWFNVLIIYFLCFYEEIFNVELEAFQNCTIFS